MSAHTRDYAMPADDEVFGGANLTDAVVRTARQPQLRTGGPDVGVQRAVAGTRFEPTVFGAVRRYWLMVVVIALVTAIGSVAYTRMVPKLYRAEARVTVPQTSMSQGESGDQYLESQVLLLQSQEVAARAARVANAALNDDVLSPRDFSLDAGSLEITPPQHSSGGYGSGIVAVSFTWPDARVAQAGTNAVLRAFDDARAAAITTETESTVVGIEKAIRDARTQGQLTALENQRTETLVNEQVDLARHPTVVLAAEPQLPINGNSKRSAFIGLVVGIVVGAAVAYLRAARRRFVEDRFDATAIYDAPLISEIPEHRNSSRDAAADLLPLAAAPQSPRAEAFRLAATHVERIRVAHGNQLAVCFVSTDGSAAKSAVVANMALAAAESGASVLAIDADSTAGALSALLLPSSPRADGFQEVLSGQRSLSDCVEFSPLNPLLTVLGCGHQTPSRTRGDSYWRAVEQLIGKAKASFGLVLIDSPALLRLADTTEIVAASDTAIVVIGPNELVRDHITMVARLDLVDTEVVGYIYQRARRLPRLARWLRGVPTARRAMVNEVPT